MNKDQIISDEVFANASESLAKGYHWVAYNTMSYFLGQGDVYYFREQEEARQFAIDNVSDLDSFRVVHCLSIDELLKQIPYGEQLSQIMEQRERQMQNIEELFQSFDWKEAFYDPLHDTIEADTDMDKEELTRMETLLSEWEKMYEENPEAALQLACKYWEGQPMEQYKNDFITIKIELMNEKNLSYLEGNLLYAGFGDQLNEQLKAEVAKQQPEFTLKLETEVSKQPVKAELYFKKSDETDMYFFNKYDVRMKAGKDQEDMAQTFYINKGHGVTLKEAYNLLNGRAVYKELENKAGEKYNAWVKLDFSEKDTQGNFKREQFHDNYGYNVVDALSKYPIKELLDEKQKEDLVASLEKGNAQIVTFEKNGTAEKLFVEANPQFKSVNVYDIKMHRIEKQALAEKYGQAMNGKENKTANQSSKQTTKQDKGDDEGGAAPAKQKAKRSRKQGIS